MAKKSKKKTGDIKADGAKGVCPQCGHLFSKRDKIFYSCRRKSCPMRE